MEQPEKWMLVSWLGDRNDYDRQRISAEQPPRIPALTFASVEDRDAAYAAYEAIKAFVAANPAARKKE